MIVSPWGMVIVAGVFEVVWAIALKLSAGFTRPIPSVITILGAFASFWFLAKAIQELPAGTAYAVWVGIGALGVALLGVLWFAEAATPLRMAGIGLIAAGITALKLA